MPRVRAKMSRRERRGPAGVAGREPAGSARARMMLGREAICSWILPSADAATVSNSPTSARYTLREAVRLLHPRHR